MILRWEADTPPVPRDSQRREAGSLHIVTKLVERALIVEQGFERR